MKQQKEQWRPQIVNLRKVTTEDGEEKWVEFDPANYVIPAGHSYYDIIKEFYKQELRKGA